MPILFWDVKSAPTTLKKLKITGIAATTLHIKCIFIQWGLIYSFKTLELSQQSNWEPKRTITLKSQVLTDSSKLRVATRYIAWPLLIIICRWHCSTVQACHALEPGGHFLSHHWPCLSFCVSYYILPSMHSDTLPVVQLHWSTISSESQLTPSEDFRWATDLIQPASNKGAVPKTVIHFKPELLSPMTAMVMHTKSITNPTL